MNIDMTLIAALLPVGKPLSKTDFIYKVKSTVCGENQKLLRLLYLLPFHMIIKDNEGRLQLH
jgi:hypothetical protein